MILFLALLVSCSPVDHTDSGLMTEPKVFTNHEIKSLRRHWPLPDVPLDTTNSYGDDPYAQHLGQYLFYDTRFSENGEVSCATCHVIFSDADYARVGTPSDDEMDMLDLAFGVTETSRLGCQIRVNDALNGLTVQVPDDM